MQLNRETHDLGEGSELDAGIRVQDERPVTLGRGGDVDRILAGGDLPSAARASTAGTAAPGETVEGKLPFRGEGGDFVCARPPDTVVGQLGDQGFEGAALQLGPPVFDGHLLPLERPLHRTALAGLNACLAAKRSDEESA